MDEFEGIWRGGGKIYTKNIVDFHIEEKIDYAEIRINKLSTYVYEIEVRADLFPDYVDRLLGFYNANTKTINAVHHGVLFKTNGISNFYIKNCKLYNGFNFISATDFITGNLKLKKQLNLK